MDGEEYKFWMGRLDTGNTRFKGKAQRFMSELLTRNVYFRYVDTSVSDSECKNKVSKDFAVVSITVANSETTVYAREDPKNLVFLIANLGNFFYLSQFFTVCVGGETKKVLYTLSST
jgi:hypothetical protein